MVIAATGGPEVFRPADLPMPMKVNAEVVVKIIAAGVNPIDSKTRAGRGTSASIAHFPVVLGVDFSGIVVESPYESCPFKPGDEVFGNVHDDTGTRSLSVLRGGGMLVNAPSGSWPTLMTDAAAAGVPATS